MSKDNKNYVQIQGEKAIYEVVGEQDIFLVLKGPEGELTVHRDLVMTAAEEDTIQYKRNTMYNNIQLLIVDTRARLDEIEYLLEELYKQEKGL